MDAPQGSERLPELRDAHDSSRLAGFGLRGVFRKGDSMDAPLFQHRPHPHQPRNVNEAHAAERQGFNEWLAIRVTRTFGSMKAFYVLVCWQVGWIILASAGVWLFKDDRYPFAFCLFLSNLIQLWALPVLAVGQNVLSRKAELQAEESFHTTEKTYHDAEEIRQHLAAQDQELQAIRRLIESRTA